MKRKKLLFAFVSALFIAVFATIAVAAPLPAGTRLLIEQGVGSDMNTPCSSGSCFGMEMEPGIVIWTDIGPGTDGGIVVGKAQLSGGQENGPSDANSTPGELTAAWSFFGNYGTFFTSPGGDTQNIFDDTSCTGADCIGKTELRVFNMALNGVIIPLGSAGGCASPECLPEEPSNSFIADYQIDLENKNWTMVIDAAAAMGERMDMML